MPRFSRWRKVIAVKTFLRRSACGESTAQAWCSSEDLDATVVHTQWPLHHVEGSWGMKLVFGLGVFPKQYQVLSLCPLSRTTCVPGKGKACGKTPVNCRCGVKCLESTERVASANPSHCLIKFKMKGLNLLPASSDSSRLNFSESCKLLCFAQES